MNTFAKLLASDLRHGITAAALPRLAFLSFVACVVYFMAATVVYAQVPNLESLSFGESLLCVFRGMQPYVPQAGIPFELPMEWLALCIVTLYVTLDYPARDLGGMGAQLIVAAHSRWAWWLGKCGWTTVCALLCWMVPVVLCAAITLATDGSWDIAVRPEVAAKLHAGDLTALNASVTCKDGTLIAVTDQPFISIASPLLAMVGIIAALQLVQTALSVVCHPFAGLLATASILFLSSYYTNEWLLGNYLMLARTDMLLGTGRVSPVVGLALALGLGCAAVVGGGLLFTRKDIIGKERDGA